MSWVVAPQCSHRSGLASPLGDLADKRQDRIADILGLALQSRQIEGFWVTDNGGDGLRDRRRGIRRNDTEPCLCPRECRLDLGAAREKSMVAKHRAHRSGAEHVGEDRRVEDADRHQPLSPRGKPGSGGRAFGARMPPNVKAGQGESGPI